MVINISQIDRWMEVYTRHLRDAVEKYPNEYMFSVEELPLVLERMREGFEKGSFLKEGKAIKATAKELGVKYTYKEINRFIRG